MKKRFLNVFLLIILCSIMVSCQKEEMIINESSSESTQEQLVVTTKSTSTWNYYTAAVPVQINHSITPGTFMLDVSNTGTRIAIVSVYPIYFFYSSSSSDSEEFFINGMKRKYSRSWSPVNLPTAIFKKKIRINSSGNAKRRCFIPVR